MYSTVSLTVAAPFPTRIYTPPITQLKHAWINALLLVTLLQAWRYFFFSLYLSLALTYAIISIVTSVVSSLPICPHLDSSSRLLFRVRRHIRYYYVGCHFCSWDGLQFALFWWSYSSLWRTVATICVYLELHNESLVRLEYPCEYRLLRSKFFRYIIRFTYVQY